MGVEALKQNAKSALELPHRLYAPALGKTVSSALGCRQLGAVLLLPRPLGEAL
jgi:hypothetical protein